MNERAKYVVSTTLTDPAGQNSTVVSVAEPAALRERPGAGLGITGSPTLVASLLREGLLDELHLLVHPLVAGRCRPRPAGRPSDLASAMPVWLLRWQAQAVGWDS